MAHSILSFLAPRRIATASLVTHGAVADALDDDRAEDSQAPHTGTQMYMYMYMDVCISMYM